MRILIAEDDETSAKFLEGLLSRIGECVVVADGEEAMREYRAALDGGRPFHLICLDIMMPLKDGQEVLKEIRGVEQGRTVPPAREAKIIMTTALDDVRSVVDAYKGGATAYITKPILSERLFETIRSFGLEA